MENNLNEQFDLKNFVNLRKQILVDVTRHYDEYSAFLKRYPRDQILRVLTCPDKPASIKCLRDMSRFLYTVSPHYRRMIGMLSTVMLNNYIIRTTNTKNTNRNTYIEICRKIKNWRIKTELPVIFTHVLLDGAFFGLVYEDKKGYMIMPVRHEYCVISSVQNGVRKFAFDLNFFTKANLHHIDQYGEEFVNAYYLYKGNKELGIEPDKTKRWFEPKRQICLKFDEELPFIVPPFIGIFKDILDIDTYAEIKKDGAILDNYKMIHYRIPTDNDGVPKLSFEQSRKYYNMSAAVVPDGIGIAMSPFAVDVLNLKENGDTAKDYTKDATRELFNNIGISPILFGITDNATSQTLELAVRTVESMMMKLVKQAERWGNTYIKEIYPKEFEMYEIMFLYQSIFNRTKVQDEYLKSAQYGMPTKMLYLASCDLEPIDAIGMSYVEDDILKCATDIMARPLISSNTLSNGSVGDEGGRPEAEVKTDSSEINSNTNDYK